MIWAVSVVVLSALVYRYLRGGGLPLGSTQLARACWMAMTALTVSAAAVPVWVTAASAALSWVALIASGHGEHQDMGRMRPGYTQDRTPYELATWPFRRLFPRAWLWRLWARELLDGAMMCWIGLLRGVLTMGAVWWFDWRFAALYTAGNTCMGLAYWLGYRVPWTLPGLRARSPEWGELFTGLAVALPLVLL